MKKIFYYLLVLLFSASFIYLNKSIDAEQASYLVFSEIQITGGSGYSTNEFIELYNPTEEGMNLSGWKLIKKTASGKEYGLVDDFGEKIVKSYSFFLITHPAGYLGETQPDFYYTTTNSIADNNTVILIDKDGNEVDKVGLGTAVDFEGEALSNPGSKKSVERKAKQSSIEEAMIEGGSDYFLGNSEDTDNNSQDFVLRSEPEPQNSQSESEYLDIEIPEVPEQPEETEDPETKEPVVEDPKSGEPKTEEPIVYSDKIVISEFFPNPEGKDDEEFIEIQCRFKRLFN